MNLNATHNWRIVDDLLAAAADGATDDEARKVGIIRSTAETCAAAVEDLRRGLEFDQVMALNREEQRAVIEIIFAGLEHFDAAAALAKVGVIEAWRTRILEAKAQRAALSAQQEANNRQHAMETEAGKMSAYEIVAACERSGIRLSIDGNVIRAQPASQFGDPHATRVRIKKAEICALLQERQATAVV
jgi:hypothetical protein